MRYFLLYMFSFLFSFSLSAEEDPTDWLNYSSKWFFSEIKSKKFSNKEFKKNDFLLIKDDYSFEYKISNKNLFAKGTWSLNKHDLIVFNYSLPSDTIRKYFIDYTEDKLILTENDIDYIFSKQPLVSSTNTSLINKILRGILGLISLIFLAFIFSRNKKNINWSLVIKGLLIQLFLALMILKVPIVQDLFEWVSSIFVTILQFSKEGALFLFGETLVNSNEFGAIFAFQILPTIIFFSALTSLLFYLGILQKVVYFFALLMKKTLKLSGAESLSAAGNIFLGQTESPLLVKPYIEKMTASELLCLMSGGMATIAGGVLAAYIGFLGGSDPEQQLFYAKHLLTASVMSAPAAVVLSKILLPETEKINEDMTISNEKLGCNSFEAISIGTAQGIRLAINVGAMILVFIAFISMINYFLNDFIGANTSLNKSINNLTNGQYDGLTLEFLLGYILAPITWLMGVCKEDMVLVGQLLGEKTILNEFVAYISLSELKDSGKFFEENQLLSLHIFYVDLLIFYQ